MSAKLWTAANSIMLAMFILSTVVQFNDPDAPVWIAVYAAAAVLTGLEIRRRTPIWAAVTLAIIAFIWSGYIGRRVHGVSLSALVAQWEMKDVHVEEAREMYGLMIVGVWMTVIACVSFIYRMGRASGASSHDASRMPS
jgi:hypothetical protein